MSYRFSKLRESDLTSLVYGNKVRDSIIKQLMNSVQKYGDMSVSCRTVICLSPRLWQTIGPLQVSVTWYRTNYTGTQMTQWDFQNKGIVTRPVRLSFGFKVPLRHLRPSVICSVPCDRILQRAYLLIGH